jgi:predicted alpha/beta hydrolase
MAHGLSGTRDASLEPYARRFADAGFYVVLFDYRYLGASEASVFRNGDPSDHDTAPAWNPANCPILIEARSPIAPPLLVYRLVHL